MAYSADVRVKVRSHYIKGQPLKAAAAIEQVPYETARGWKRKAKAEGDCWDTARAALRMSASGVQSLTAEVIEDFVHLFQSTIEQLKSADEIQPLAKAEAIAKLSDAYQKTIKAAGASNPEISKLAVAMDVLQRQMEFIRLQFPQHINAFVEVLEPLGEELSRVYG